MKNKNWIIYIWILLGNIVLYVFMAIYFSSYLINNKWSGLVWFACGVISMNMSNFFYKKTVESKNIKNDKISFEQKYKIVERKGRFIVYKNHLVCKRKSLFFKYFVEEWFIPCKSYMTLAYFDTLESAQQYVNKALKPDKIHGVYCENNRI